jgi:hypothetical protein
VAEKFSLICSFVYLAASGLEVEKIRPADEHKIFVLSSDSQRFPKGITARCLSASSVSLENKQDYIKTRGACQTHKSSVACTF